MLQASHAAGHFSVFKDPVPRVTETWGTRKLRPPNPKVKLWGKEFSTTHHIPSTFMFASPYKHKHAFMFVSVYKHESTFMLVSGYKHAHDPHPPIPPGASFAGRYNPPKVNHISTTLRPLQVSKNVPVLVAMVGVDGGDALVPTVDVQSLGKSSPLASRSRKGRFEGLVTKLCDHPTRDEKDSYDWSIHSSAALE
jgi:hypothetical protein